MMWVIAVGYCLLENNYFGWNRTPQSPEEVIADGFQYLLFTLAWMQYRNAART